jgi:hypothetical protein
MRINASPVEKEKLAITTKAKSDWAEVKNTSDC